MVAEKQLDADPVKTADFRRRSLRRKVYMPSPCLWCFNRRLYVSRMMPVR